MGEDEMARIFHVTTAAEWQDATAAGVYVGSTRDKSLADVGYIHCSFAAQTADIVATIYADCTEPLVLLEIDPTAVPAEIKVEPAPGKDQTFPHIYGPLPAPAVIHVHPLTS